MNKFANAVINKTNRSGIRTENGAVTNKSTLNPVLDVFALGAAKRGQDLTKFWDAAFAVDPILSTVVAFYLRAPTGRGGQGERQLFRDFLKYLYNENRDIFYRVFTLVPQYGRWDDLFAFIDDKNIAEFIHNQFVLDLTALMTGQNPSLLGKWLPSENASKKETIALAKKFHRVFKMSPRDYRVALTNLRKKLAVLEPLMSAGKWDEINFSAVPSKAHTINRKAFGKHVPDKYAEYLGRVKKGTAKINSTGLYPYDLAWQVDKGQHDATIEAQWKALPDFVLGSKNVLAVVDLSGSMSTNKVSGTNMSCYVPAIALGIYLAERNKGQFHNLLMTFDHTSEFVRLTEGQNLNQKFRQVKSTGSGMGTNVQSVFETLLLLARMNEVPEEDMPALIIFSDMQFNSVGGRSTNYDVIKQKYRAAGYSDKPKLTFWNLNARVDEVAATKNDENVFLVSGLSPDVMKNVLGATAKTPAELMMETLTGEVFTPLWEVLK